MNLLYIVTAKLRRCSLFAVMLCLLLLSACDHRSRSDATADEDVEDQAMAMMSSDDFSGFRQAEGRREFVFPSDHGHHDGYRTEWWYVTGNLHTDEGRRFGYQLTFFRVLMQPPGSDHQADAEQGSSWRTAAVWLAQAAVSDIQRERFYTSEQLSRELPGLADAASDRLQVRVNGWSLTAPADDPLATGEMTLFMDSVDFSLALTLEADKPVVLQGDDGLSRKSADDAASASWYYSLTRLSSTGELRLSDADADSVYAVSGSSWLDREWSTSALSARQSGWDWFALQLDNGHDLMYYRLRLEDGSIDAASAGVLVDPAGKVTHLRHADVSATPLANWYSRQSDNTYPVSWRLQSASGDWQLQLDAMIPNQAWSGQFQYWEGAGSVSGDWLGDNIKGQGYVELTGYD
jgi:predicted secreted hydrolase